MYLQHQFLNLCQWWDYAKVQIRVFCQQYKTNCSRSKQLCFDALKQEILRLQGGAEDVSDDKRCQLLYEKQTLLKEPVQGDGIGA